MFINHPRRLLDMVVPLIIFHGSIHPFSRLPCLHEESSGIPVFLLDRFWDLDVWHYLLSPPYQTLSPSIYHVSSLL